MGKGGVVHTTGAAGVAGGPGSYERRNQRLFSPFHVPSLGWMLSYLLSRRPFQKSALILVVILSHRHRLRELV